MINIRLVAPASTARGTRHSALGTRHPAPGARHPAPGTRHPAPGTDAIARILPAQPTEWSIDANSREIACQPKRRPEAWRCTRRAGASA